MFPPCPQFEFSVIWPADVICTHQFVYFVFFSLFGCSEWVVHDMPRYLVLTGAELINSFVQGKGFDSDSIDVAFRRFRQLDSTIQTDGLRVRWRHFIESDFAVLSCQGLVWTPTFGVFTVPI